jgi:hypothetical protein
MISLKICNNQIVKIEEEEIIEDSVDQIIEETI